MRSFMSCLETKGGGVGKSWMASQPLVGPSRPCWQRLGIWFPSSPVLLPFCSLVSNSDLLLSSIFASEVEPSKPMGQEFFHHIENLRQEPCGFSSSIVQSMFPEQLSKGMTWIYKKTKQKNVQWSHMCGKWDFITCITSQSLYCLSLYWGLNPVVSSWGYDMQITPNLANHGPWEGLCEWIIMGDWCFTERYILWEAP